MAERGDFWKEWNGKLMKEKFAAVLDERASAPIRPELPGYESYMYGKGYIRFLPRNLHDVYLDIAKGVAHTMPDGRQFKGESDYAYNIRVKKMAADGLLRIKSQSPGTPDLIVRVPTPLEISTAMRFMNSKSILNPSRPPIPGVTVATMIEILDGIKAFRVGRQMTNGLRSILMGTMKLIETHEKFPAELEKEKLRREKVEASAMSAWIPPGEGSPTDVVDA